MEAELKHEQGILLRLKSETRLHHTQIENSIPLFTPNLNQERYLEILKGFYGYVPAAEALLAPYLAEIPELDFSARRKSQLLLQDLQTLGLSKSEIEAIPSDVPLPVVHDRASALGVMYVLEGSTLGGQLIAKHLCNALGVRAETGAKFYTGYGKETGPRWKSFQAVLQQQLVSESDQHSAILAAQQTFVTMGTWMSPGPGSTL